MVAQEYIRKLGPWHPVEERQAAFHGLAQAKGQGFLSLLEREGLFEPLWHTLPNVSWPAEARSAAIASVARATHLLTQGMRVARLFREINAQVLFLRGPWFAQRYYGDPAARRSSDLDVVIWPQARAAVHDLLTAHGFRPRFNLSPAQFDYYAARHGSMQYTHEQESIQLDVHWRLWDPPWEWDLDLWQDSATDENNVALPSPLGDAVCALGHGLQHGWLRWLHLWDVAAVWRTLPAAALDRLCEIAKRSYKQRALAVTAALVERIAGWEIPPEATRLRALLREYSAISEKVSERLLSQHERYAESATRWPVSGLGREISAPLLDRFADRLRPTWDRIFCPSGLDLEAFSLRRRWMVAYPLVRVLRLVVRGRKRVRPREASSPFSREEYISLVRELIQDGVPVVFRVRGASMFPFLRSGETVRLEPLGERRLTPGDVVAAGRRGQVMFLHRIVRTSADGQSFLIQGDSCMKPDGWFTRSDIIGFASMVLRRGVWVPVQTDGWAVRTWLAARPLLHSAAAGYRKVWRLASRGA